MHIVSFSICDAPTKPNLLYTKNLYQMLTVVTYLLVKAMQWDGLVA